MKKLCALSESLKDSSISINRSVLTSYSMETLQSECRSVLEQLQEKGMFSLAREVAALAELPVDNVVIQEVQLNNDTHLLILLLLSVLRMLLLSLPETQFFLQITFYFNASTPNRLTVSAMLKRTV